MKDVVGFIGILSCVFELLVLLFDIGKDGFHIFLEYESGFHGDDFEFAWCIGSVFGWRWFRGAGLFEFIKES